METASNSTCLWDWKYHQVVFQEVKSLLKSIILRKVIIIISYTIFFNLTSCAYINSYTHSHDYLFVFPCKKFSIWNENPRILWIFFHCLEWTMKCRYVIRSSFQWTRWVFTLIMLQTPYHNIYTSIYIIFIFFYKYFLRISVENIYYFYFLHFWRKTIGNFIIF